jgi:glycosyltransferase involved in cell wall biosynthesis
MKISLVTPCFQASHYIAETIESVLNQQNADFEYWIIDGGSTDGTLEIIQGYASDSRLRWISEKDEGQSDALNKGLQLCTGDIFNWINADDTLTPGALRAVAGHFASSKYDIVSGQTLEFSESDPEETSLCKLPLRASAEETICRGIYCQPSTFWRMRLIRDLGGVATYLHYVMDWYLWVRYLAQFGQQKVLLKPDVWARFRKHADSKTMTQEQGFHAEALAVFRKLFDDLGMGNEIPFQEAELGGVPAKIALPDFQFGPHFQRNRLLGCYCDRVAGRLYRKQLYADARRWLALAQNLDPRVSWARMKMGWRLRGKK